jgi:hypothetical protein
MSERESMRLVARWETDPGPIVNWIELRHDGECHWMFSKSCQGPASNPDWMDEQAIEIEQGIIDGINAQWTPLGITMRRVL